MTDDVVVLNQPKRDNDAPKTNVDQETNTDWAWDIKARPSKGRAGSRSVEEYIDMGYTADDMEKHLVNFIKEYDSVISAEDIVDRWKTVEKKIAKLPAERILAIIEKVGNLCKEKELTLTQVQNLGSFGAVVSGEQVMALWSAVSGGKQTNTVKFHKFIQPRILEVATKANSVKK